MVLSPADYGPFAPAVGYAGAIMATGAAILLLWAGKMRKWRPPDEDLPGGAQALVLLLCGLGMVFLWYFATPTTIGWIFGIVALLALLTIVSFLSYTGLLNTYRYTKQVSTSPTTTEQVYILGGRQLLAEAEAKRQQYQITVQTLLEGAQYDPDHLWDRSARQWVKQRVLIYFIMTLAFGTWALTGASFATQVLLTQKAAASIIRTEDAPGLK
jgi:membrane protein implicated in regulation of membrane protease activity